MKSLITPLKVGVLFIASLVAFAVYVWETADSPQANWHLPYVVITAPNPKIKELSKSKPFIPYSRSNSHVSGRTWKIGGVDPA